MKKKLVMGCFASELIAEAKWLSLAMSMPTEIMRLCLPFIKSDTMIFTSDYPRRLD